MARNSLFYRSKLFATDIADAIDAIVSRSKGGPVPVTKDQVASELIRLANTDDDGLTVSLSKTSEELTRDRFRVILNDTGIFTNGYMFYSDLFDRSTTPVTKYFFEHVYDSDALDCLGAMTVVDIRQSLPKRPSVPVGQDGSPLCADDDDYPMSGKIVGVVVDPRGYDSPLQRAWLERQASGVLGAVKQLSKRIERMEPSNDRVEDLNAAGAALRRHMQLALPARSDQPNGGAS
jgi:hypothetical protein